MAKRKKITIESLAAMIKRGFDKTASKDEAADLRDEVSGIKREMTIFHSELERLGADVHDIKITLGLMTRAVAS